MLHAKFRSNLSTSSEEENFLRVFTIYGHGSHLGHVTWIIYIHIGFPFPQMLHMKFGFDCPRGFREMVDDDNNGWMYTTCLPIP